MSSLADWTLAYQGKVRDVYIPKKESSIAKASKLLVVASDRVSAFDVILSPDIPGKGAALTRISNWWMNAFDFVPNHLLADKPPAEVADRAVVATPLSMLPVECGVRGFLVGSGWKEYKVSKTVCGIDLPSGLSEGDRLPEPIFTPATKAAIGDHDENISYSEVEKLLGPEHAAQVRELSLRVYQEAQAVANKSGLLLADTKMEFGIDPDGVLTLGDELLTPDSSRYWDAANYAAGGPQRLDSFDKQIIRNWLAANWDQEGTPPELPADVVDTTQKKYRELEERLIGAEV